MPASSRSRPTWGTLALAFLLSASAALAQVPHPSPRAIPVPPSRALPPAAAAADPALRRTVLVADGLPAMPSIPSPTIAPGDAPLAPAADPAPVNEPGPLSVPSTISDEAPLPAPADETPSIATPSPTLPEPTPPDTTDLQASERQPIMIQQNGQAASAPVPTPVYTTTTTHAAVATTTTAQPQASLQGSAPSPQAASPQSASSCGPLCRPHGWGGASNIAQGTGQILGGFGNIIKGTGKMVAAGLHCLGNKTETAFDKSGRLFQGGSHLWNKVGEGCARHDLHTHTAANHTTPSSQAAEPVPSLLSPQSSN